MKPRLNFVGMSLGETTNQMLYKIQNYMRTSKQETCREMLEGLRKKEIEAEFKTFLSGFKRLKNLEPSASGGLTPIYLSSEMHEYFESVFWDFDFNNKTLFFKYLIYFYYNKYIGDVKKEFHLI